MLGAAYAAGLAVDYWPEVEYPRSHWRENKRWLPQMDPEARAEQYAQWKKAVSRTLNWVET